MSNSRFNVKSQSNSNIVQKRTEVNDTYSNTHIWVKENASVPTNAGYKSRSRQEVITMPRSMIGYETPFVNPGYIKPLLSKKAKQFFDGGVTSQSQVISPAVSAASVNNNSVLPNPQRARKRIRNVATQPAKTREEANSSKRSSFYNSQKNDSFYSHGRMKQLHN